MHRLKKNRHSPRTLYNGPFVLPNPSSLRWMKQASSPSCHGLTPSLYSHWRGQPVGNLHGQVYHSPVTPWTQRGLASFLYRNDISTARSDEGCRPVFNLSFLDDSVASTDYPTQTRGSWKLGSPALGSSRDVRPNNNGPNGQFKSPSAYTSPMPVFTGLSVPEGHLVYSPRINTLPHSSLNTVSTPKISQFQSPKSNLPPLSGLGPPYGQMIRNKPAHSQGSCDHRHSQQVTSSGNNKQLWPQFVKNASPVFTDAQQNQGLYAFYPSQTHQLYPRRVYENGGPPAFNSPNGSIFYSYNPKVSQGFPPTFDSSETWASAASDQHQGDSSTIDPYFHQNPLSHPSIYNTHRYNFPRTDTCQTLALSSLLNHKKHSVSDQRFDTKEKCAVNNGQTVVPGKSYSQKTAHRNLDIPNASYPQQRYVPDLQTVSEYAHHQGGDSSCTRQRSFFNSTVSSDQSQSIIKSEQNNNFTTTADCRNDSCTCKSSTAIDFSASHQTASRQDSSEDRSKTGVFPLKPIQNPKQFNSNCLRYVTGHFSTARENLIVSQNCAAARKQKWSPQSGRGLDDSHFKTLGNIAGSTYHGPGNYHCVPVNGNTYRDSSRRNTRTFNNRRRGDNFRQNEVPGVYPASHSNDARKYSSDIPKKEGTSQDSKNMRKQTNWKTKEELYPGNQFSSKFQTFRVFENDSVSEASPYSVGGKFKGARNNQRMQAEGRNRLQAEGRNRLQAEGRNRLQAEGRNRLQAEDRNRLQAEGRNRLQAEGRNRLQAEGRNRLQAERERSLRQGNIRDQHCYSNCSDRKHRFHQSSRQQIDRGNVSVRWNGHRKTKPIKVYPDHLSVSGSRILKEFSEELKAFEGRTTNPVQRLHECARFSSLPIQILCEMVPMVKDNKDEGFTAVLSINNINLATRTGKSKRLVKQKVYDQAVYVLLRTLSAHKAASSANGVEADSDVTDMASRSCDAAGRSRVDGGKSHGVVVNFSSSIADSTDSNIQEKPRDDEKEIEAVHQKVEDVRRAKMRMDQTALCHLDRLIRDLKSFREDDRSKVSQIWTVDKHCVKNRLKLIAIYKGVS
ncbi:signal recognition particle receptor FtsY [Elysia marginata]|uniref:Signal recognition particle receptor FtsY n=1 Tax=Elysia marginata TaxID=1093978 RepID=A0AAV4EAV8_9GAST|nr:signal recognition particle receptor FtsY [Elysia marginata]